MAKSRGNQTLGNSPNGEPPYTKHSQDPEVALLPAQLLWRLAHPQHLRGHTANNRVLGHVFGDHRVRAHDAVVPDANAPQNARPITHPNIAANPHVALVDALQSDRTLDLHHAVVEVDQHHPVGDDALAADRHVLVGGDRALLAHHGLRADRNFALVHTDLGVVSEPGPTADAERRVAADLQLHAWADDAS